MTSTRFPSFLRHGAALMAVPFLLSACVAGPAPRNIPSADWMPEQSRGIAAVACRMSPGPVPSGLAAAGFRPAADLVALQVVAPGDRLRLRIAGSEDVVSGVFVVDPGGMLTLPGLAGIRAEGLGEAALQARVYEALATAEIIRRLPDTVDLRLIESAGVSVAVTGAVFAPGSVRAGERPSDSRVGQREGIASGDMNAGRTLGSALRAAGGVRPDADIANIYLVRGEGWTRFDLTGAVSGDRIADIPLASGDRIIVPSGGCFQPSLVRPSAITQPGIRVYMSNLSRSANNNAGAAVGKDSTSLPYGTRLLQGLVAMNCVGGSSMNAGRRAVLISRNPINGASIVVEREVEKLVRGVDRDAVDPYLMPDDAIACYDSRSMNFADAIGLVSSAFGAVTPAILLRNAVSR